MKVQHGENIANDAVTSFCVDSNHTSGGEDFII